MDRCTKIKVFNILLVFCAANFFLYRYFSRPDTPMMVAPIKAESPSSVRYSSATSAAKVPNDTGGKLSITSSSSERANGTPSVSAGNENPSLDSGDSKGKEAPTKSDENIRRDAAEPTKSVNAAVGTTQAKQNSPAMNTSLAKQSSSVTAQAQTQDTSREDTNSSLPVQGPLPLCPLVPPRLNGALATYSEASAFDEIAKENPGVKPGGRYQPPDCISRNRVAIVIPYRNREEHLKILLKNLHPMLQRQQLDYGIYIVDQALPGKFNRAMLMNIGYAEAMKRYDYQCAIFHDVDLIPENDKNIYSCPEQPRHLSAAIDKFKYRLPYANIYGGVSAVSKDQFEKINGFSNMFFGWGGEDDDMAKRIQKGGLKITRYPMEIARYKMIKHTKDSGNEQNPQRFALLKTTEARMATDGLNSLVYTVQEVEELPTHTRIQVLINENDIVKKKH